MRSIDEFSLFSVSIEIVDIVLFVLSGDPAFVNSAVVQFILLSNVTWLVFFSGEFACDSILVFSGDISLIGLSLAKKPK